MPSLGEVSCLPFSRQKPGQWLGTGQMTLGFGTMTAFHFRAEFSSSAQRGHLPPRTCSLPLPVTITQSLYLSPHLPPGQGPPPCSIRDGLCGVPACACVQELKGQRE